MFRILHIKTLEPYEETMDACVKACYNCLLRFRNQFEHKYINRKLLIPLMKVLKNYTLNKVSEDSETDINEKLVKLKEKCDSDLEKSVLDEILKQKLPLPNGCQKTYYDDDVPITKVDFFYSHPQRELCLFIDGPPHTIEAVQRVDREKRNILESKGYTVIELDFKDGKYRDDPSLIEKEVSKLKDYLI